MPTRDLSELNTVISVLGAFIILYGICSVLIKQRWYLGEALPAVIIGIVLGPVAAKIIDSEKFGFGSSDQTHTITLGVARVMIGIQLVIAGYSLPARYTKLQWRDLTICLFPVTTIMWFCTAACIMATIPKVTFLGGLVIAACVAGADPILSQAIAKGPFADKYMKRPLREIMSAEAAASGGFGFPFLMLASYLIRCEGSESIGLAIKDWILETWLYMMLLSIVYGLVVGFGALHAVKYAIKRKWIDTESYLLIPTALGLFITGTCGAIGTNDLLACFVAGTLLNWDGEFLSETERRHDEVNSCVDVLLNFGGFMYIGSVIPWSEFHDPEGTGVTIGRLFGLGFLVLLLRRIPAMLLSYKLMPSVVTSYKEALLAGYLSPVGAGAVFYVEYTRRHLLSHDDNIQENDLLNVIIPVVYWLVFFSIITHGLSIPALDLIYRRLHVDPIREDPVEMRRSSMRISTPPNAIVGDAENFVVYNRFRRPVVDEPSRPIDTLKRTPSVRSVEFSVDDVEEEKKRQYCDICYAYLV